MSDELKFPECPYPVDVFGELSPDERSSLLAALKGNTPVDRLHADWGRQVWANCIEATKDLNADQSAEIARLRAEVARLTAELESCRVQFANFRDTSTSANDNRVCTNAIRNITAALADTADKQPSTGD